MALKSTIYKAELQVSDMDRHHYGSYALTVACHPSETPERMMMRVLAFALQADERLAFAKGLSDAEEPDLWLKDDTGAIALWMEVGLPDERRMLKACGKADRVVIYSYGTPADVWWKQIGNRIERQSKLEVWHIAPEVTQQFETLVQRTMQLQCMIQDGQVWFGNGETTLHVVPQRWK